LIFFGLDEEIQVFRRRPGSLLNGLQGLTMPFFRSSLSTSC
jgi:hypothetical protein